MTLVRKEILVQSAQLIANIDQLLPHARTTGLLDSLDDLSGADGTRNLLLALRFRRMKGTAVVKVKTATQSSERHRRINMSTINTSTYQHISHQHVNTMSSRQSIINTSHINTSTHQHIV
jgi:hypothetical protein